MTDSFISMADKVALSPGSLIYVGPSRDVPVRVEVISYDPDGFQETEVTDLQELAAVPSRDKISWIKVQGIHDTNVIEEIGKRYTIHSLVLEDILNGQEFSICLGSK